MFDRMTQEKINPVDPVNPVKTRRRDFGNRLKTWLAIQLPS